MDPETPQGQEFRSAWEEALGEYDVPRELPVAERQNATKKLQLPHLKEINDELAKRKRSPWYAAFGGPANLRKLAQASGRLTEYDLIYKHWSSIVHGGNADVSLVRVGDTEATFRLIRDPLGLPKTASFAVTFILRCTKIMVGYYRPGESLGGWYEREVKGPWDRLKGVESRLEYRRRPES